MIRKLINLFKYKPYKLGGLADMEKGKTILKATYECLVCGHGDTVTYNVDSYMEVKVCPKCSGAYVDLWKIHKYKHLIRSAEDKVNDHKETLDKALKDLRESVDLWGAPSKEQVPLLTIELQDETSVPKVFYKGEEIIRKVSMSFVWETETSVDIGRMDFDMEYAEPRKDSPPVVRRIGHSK